MVLEMKMAGFDMMVVMIVCLAADIMDIGLISHPLRVAMMDLKRLHM